MLSSLRSVGLALVLCGGMPLIGDMVAADETAERVTVDARSVVAYVESCRKPNGAFGPLDQEYTDAAWNYPAVETLALLGESIDRSDDVLAHGLGFPKGHAGYGHRQFFHEHLLRRRLGKPTVAAHRTVEVRHQGFTPRYYGSPLGTDDKILFQAGGQADPRDVAARTLGYYNLSSLYLLLAGLEASGREPADPNALIHFVRLRQAPGGGFVDLRTENGTPRDEDAHVAHTFCALASLKLLRGSPLRTAACTRFVQACRLPSGGHGWNPAADLPGNVADVYYTWAALRSLKLLGEVPKKPEQTLAWLNTLQNADGGFGDQPGWRSRLYSTYYAVDALAQLGTDARSGITSKQVRRPRLEPIADGEFRIYQALFKVPVVAESDLEGLHQRGFNLLGLKSDKFDDATRLPPTLGERKLPLDIILCPEAYPHRLLGLGGVELNHVGNFTLDPRWTAAEQAAWRTADEAGQKNLPWSEYRRTVLEPLRRNRVLSYPEQDFEQEHAYIAYGDGGYNAVLVGFNWAPRDFVRVFPWRERYVGRLTPIADADSHGDLAKWSPQLDHTRMLYLAKEPSYAGFLEAAAAGRVVGVVAEPEGVASGATYYGRPAAVEYAKRRVAEWRWWKTE
jgi:prenyltransferase beta subunit